MEVRKMMEFKKLDKPDMCLHLEPEIYEGILCAWFCEDVNGDGWICPHVGDDSVWCPLRAHAVTSQTVEDDTTHWEIE
jgi:hypothetical protein